MISIKCRSALHQSESRVNHIASIIKHLTARQFWEISNLPDWNFRRFSSFTGTLWMTQNWFIFGSLTSASVSTGMSILSLSGWLLLFSVSFESFSRRWDYQWYIPICYSRFFLRNTFFSLQRIHNTTRICPRMMPRFQWVTLLNLDLYDRWSDSLEMLCLPMSATPATTTLNTASKLFACDDCAKKRSLEKRGKMFFFSLFAVFRYSNWH